MITAEVSGSPNARMPTVMAVSGSKAPKMATWVLSISFNDMMSSTLLRAVGKSPNNKRHSRLRLLPIGWMPPVVKAEYNMSINMAMKNT
jgi:hypothetical protein